MILGQHSLRTSMFQLVSRSILVIFTLAVTAARPSLAYDLPPDIESLTNHYARINCKMISEGISSDVIYQQLLYAVINDPRASTYNEPQKAVILIAVKDKVLERCPQ